METIDILQKLISIPSWVDKNTNEMKIGNWIYDYLKNNSKLIITKQKIAESRFNVFAKNSNSIDILITGHMDTVQPGIGWTKSPIIPEIIDNKLYGLGSTDMKSGLAIMLSMAIIPNLSKRVGFLFYCDEEYDFLGMKKFIEKYGNEINPKTIISLDLENLQITNACRGLIELKVDITGKSGHSGNPKSGINAITESLKVISKLKKWLKLFKSNELGNSTLNIAYINGGGSEGNIIAESCEYIVEVRVANENLNANLVKEFITKESIKLGMKIKSINIRHNLGSWITKKEELKKYIKLSEKKELKSARKTGYVDIQMLWKTFNKIPTFNFGVGSKGMSHSSDEYIDIQNVVTAKKFFETLLTE